MKSKKKRKIQSDRKMDKLDKFGGGYGLGSNSLGGRRQALLR